MIIRRNKKLEDVISEWLLFKKLSLKESTFFRYKYITEKYILSNFKNKRLNHLINYDFNDFISCLSKDLSTRTIYSIVTVLKGILKYIEEKYNYKYNINLISIPKNNSKSKEAKSLDIEEVERLKSHCLNSLDCKEIGIAMSLLTGIRLGELCALKWKNIDLNSNVIYIEENLQRVYMGKSQTKVIEDTPKTQNSIRLVPIPQKLLSALKDISCDNNFNDNDYFLTGSQKYTEPRSYQYFFKKCLKMCEIKNCNFHILRHSFATNCIRLGMDVKSLSVVLGHSNVQMTLNRYVHPSFETQKKFLDQL